MSVVDDIIRREGSEFTNDPNDYGGATKYGITQRAWDDYVAHNPAAAPARSVEALTEPMAREFYQVVHVLPFSFIVDQDVFALAVDSSVLHGAPHVAHWLQSCVGVASDGRIGPDTRSAVNGAPPAHLYTSLLRTRFIFEARTAANDPSQLKFLAGWIDRSCEFLSPGVSFGH
jgi:lysozyme family protein